MAPVRKGHKFKRVLKTAARLPVRAVTGGRGSGRSSTNPLPGEGPVITLRIQIVGCTDLLAKGKNGFSDPFVVVSMLNHRQQTPVSKRNVNPLYLAKDATFDFPIYLSLADRLGVVEFLVWDKDMLKKEYLGEVALPVEDWFRNGNSTAFNDPENQIFSLGLISSRHNRQATGTIQIKLGFVDPPNAHNVDYDAIFSELITRTRPSLVSAPATEGVGTVRSNLTPFFEDDGGISSEDDDEDDEEEVVHSLAQLHIPPPVINLTLPPALALPLSPALPLPLSPTTPAATRTPIAPKPHAHGFIPKIRRAMTPSASASSSTSYMSAGPSTPSGSMTPFESIPISHEDMRPLNQRSVSMGGLDTLSPTPPIAKKGRRFRRRGGGNKREFNLSSDHDIVGIVMLEIHGATDLPRLKNLTRTGFDMDPAVVISFGKKVFRTRVIRHSRDPVWDEKLLFHVRRYETNFKIALTILDWDKLSSNDYVGETSIDVAELIKYAPQKDPETGLYAAEDDGDHPMKQFNLPLTTAKEVPWEAKHKPVLSLKAKYQPYAALRQRFWRQYLKQYDTDDTGSLSHLELTSMLDSLGSTLSRQTVNSFFTRNHKSPKSDELTVDEAIMCLETEVRRPESERKLFDPDADNDQSASASAMATPNVFATNEKSHGLALENLDFSGPSLLHAMNGNGMWSPSAEGRPTAPPSYPTERSELPLHEVATALSPSTSLQPAMMKRGDSYGSDAEGEYSSDGGSPRDDEVDTLERVINIKNCPLCHRPRLNAKAEVDIVTHLAVCASQDWVSVNKIVVANFVTSSQAQRKILTKVWGKISKGDYRIGADSANIIVQNRMTGQLEEEKMQVYIRLGIRLLYKGATSRMEGTRARRLLKSLSVKQGVKFDDPASAKDIAAFIDFHRLDMSEVLEPIDAFKTFNEFFYRKLKPDARPVEAPEDPLRLVSTADCRMIAFESINEATRLWIKGREFTVGRLLGSSYSAEKYAGGALGIFRLAPQDYHRFHSPVDGVVGPSTYIAGEYYTVNPQAIRSSLDVYGENARKIVPIDSPHFGRVMCVLIGAMMVGTIRTTIEEGQPIQRGQEIGYFAFGGSTVVLLFERGAVEWDEDLLINGQASLETLVRVGMGIGRGRRVQRERNPSS